MMDVQVAQYIKYFTYSMDEAEVYNVLQIQFVVSCMLWKDHLYYGNHMILMRYCTKDTYHQIGKFVRLLPSDIPEYNTVDKKNYLLKCSHTLA